MSGMGDHGVGDGVGVVPGLPRSVSNGGCHLHPFTLFLKLGWKFYDADDYHPEENRMKMGKGIPLNDQVTCADCFQPRRSSWEPQVGLSQHVVWETSCPRGLLHSTLKPGTCGPARGQLWP